MKVISITSLVFIIVLSCQYPDFEKDKKVTKVKIRPEMSAVERLRLAGMIMTLKELRKLVREEAKRGRRVKGYGKTVFEGTKPEKFEIEIIDIIKGWFPKQEIIVIEARHPILEKAGIVSGMSGSPIYVNDKIIGALAYGWFSKIPIGGVTPIEYMIREMERPLIGEVKSIVCAEYPENSLRPIKTPVCISSASPKLLKIAEEVFKDSNFTFIPSGKGSARFETHNIKLEEGSALGVPLITGDFEWSAVGTLTLIDGDNLLSFGHDFFGAGEIELPVTTAVVHKVIPRIIGSFKMSSCARSVGCVIQDRTNAVYAKLGKVAKMVPVRITIANTKAKNPVPLNIRIVRHKRLFPRLLYIAISRMITTYEPSWQTNALTVGIKVKLKNYGLFEYENVYHNEETTSNWYITDPIDQMFGYRHEKPQIENVEVNLTYCFVNRFAEILRVWPDKDEVEDGEKVTINLLLRAFGRKDVIRKIDIQLPEGLKGQTINFIVGGGQYVPIETQHYDTFKEYIDAIKTYYTSDALVVFAQIPSYTFRHRGRILEKIPNSMLAQLIPNLVEGGIVEKTFFRKVEKIDLIVRGAAKLSIKIK
jgi:hypothetical protein